MDQQETPCKSLCEFSSARVSICGIRRYRSFSRKADNIGDLTAKGKWSDYFAAWVKTKVNEIFITQAKHK
jgi:hypothetical protein